MRIRSHSSVWLAAAALAAGCANREPALPSPGPISGDPIELSYQLRAGEIWNYDVEATQQMGAAGEGGPRITMRYTLVMKIVAADAAGGTIALRFEDFAMKSEPAMPARGGQLDFKDVDITATLSRTGVVDDLQVSVPGGRDPSMYRTIVQNALMPFRLAERAVRINESWTSDEVVPTRLMGLSQSVDFRASTRSWMKAIQPDGARIQMVGLIDLPRQTVNAAEGTIGSGPVEVASAGQVAIEVVFDRERGRVIQLAGDMRSKMDIVTGDDRIVIHAGGTTRMLLRPVVAVR